MTADGPPDGGHGFVGAAEQLHGMAVLGRVGIAEARRVLHALVEVAGLLGPQVGLLRPLGHGVHGHRRAGDLEEGQAQTTVVGPALERLPGCVGDVLLGDDLRQGVVQRRGLGHARIERVGRLRILVGPALLLARVAVDVLHDGGGGLGRMREADRSAQAVVALRGDVVGVESTHAVVVEARLDALVVGRLGRRAADVPAAHGSLGQQEVGLPRTEEDAARGLAVAEAVIEGREAAADGLHGGAAPDEAVVARGDVVHDEAAGVAVPGVGHLGLGLLQTRSVVLALGRRVVHVLDDRSLDVAQRGIVARLEAVLVIAREVVVDQGARVDRGGDAIEEEALRGVIGVQLVVLLEALAQVVGRLDEGVVAVARGGLVEHLARVGQHGGGGDAEVGGQVGEGGRHRQPVAAAVDRRVVVPRGARSLLDAESLVGSQDARAGGDGLLELGLGRGGSRLREAHGQTHPQRDGELLPLGGVVLEGRVALGLVVGRHDRQVDGRNHLRKLAEEVGVDLLDALELGVLALEALDGHGAEAVGEVGHGHHAPDAGEELEVGQELRLGLGRASGQVLVDQLHGHDAVLDAACDQAVGTAVPLVAVVAREDAVVVEPVEVGVDGPAEDPGALAVIGLLHVALERLVERIVRLGLERAGDHRLLVDPIEVGAGRECERRGGQGDGRALYDDVFHRLYVYVRIRAKC